MSVQRTYQQPDDRRLCFNARRCCRRRWSVFKTKTTSVRTRCDSLKSRRRGVSQNCHQGLLETRPPTHPAPSPAHTIADQPPSSPSTPLHAHTIIDSNSSVSQMPPSRIMHRDRDAVWNTYLFMSLRMQHDDFWGNVDRARKDFVSACLRILILL